MSTKEVRQVLMNEMGLTRETIREETRRIIQDTAEKFLSQLLETGELGKILVDASHNELRKKERYPKLLSQYVEDGAKAAAREWISNNVEIRGVKP